MRRWVLATAAAMNIGNTTQTSAAAGGVVTDLNDPGPSAGKVFPYSLPSVGPGADPGVQAVSPQVT